MPDAGRTIEFQMEFALLAARFGKVLLAPILEFVDKFNGVIAGFRNFFEAVRKRKIAEDSPEHHGERKGHPFGVESSGVSREGRSGKNGRGAGNGRAEAGAYKLASAHLRPQAIHCGRFSE